MTKKLETGYQIKFYMLSLMLHVISSDLSLSLRVTDNGCQVAC